MLSALVEVYSVTQAVQGFGCSGKGFLYVYRNKKCLCGVMVLLTPTQLLQWAGSPLQGAVHRQGGLINAVLLKKNGVGKVEMFVAERVAKQGYSCGKGRRP